MIILNHLQNCVNNIANVIQTKKTDLFNGYIPNFTSVAPLSKDTVELSNNTKKIKIKDLNNNDVDAVIISKESDYDNIGMYGIPRKEKKFFINVDGKQLGYMIVSNVKNALYVDELYTKEHEYRKYKGAGTALIKCAVDESIKRGYNGKIKLQASHGAASPMMFYYKNNFIVPKSTKNAVLQFALKNDIPINQLLLEYQTSATMTLDENGANALLNNKRLCQNRSCENAAQKFFCGKNYTASFIQSPNENEHALLITKEGKSGVKAVLAVIMEESQSDNKHFIVNQIEEFSPAYPDDTKFALETIQNIAKEKGFGQTTIAKNTDFETQDLYENCSTELPEED